MSVASKTEPLPSPVSARGAAPFAATYDSFDDRWAAWVASERQRHVETRREIFNLLLGAVVVAALGGALYLSYGGSR
jgi:hypothetical protein